MRSLLLTEIMVEHIYSNSQFRLIISCSGVSFVFCAIVSPTCKYFNPTRVIDMNDGQFNTYFPIA